MNGSLVDDLMRQLQGAPTGQIAQQLGTDQNTAANAISAALPMIVGALGSNAQQPGGASALLNALQRDHAGAGAMDLGGLLGGLLGGGQSPASAPTGGLGGLGDLLGSVLGGGAPANRQMDGGGILGHIFGSAQPRAESGLGQATGMSSGQAGNLMKILAPIVMAALAKQVMARNMDAGSLGSALGQDRAQLQNQGGLGGGLLNAVLDQNGDGKLDISDLLKIGGSLLGGRR
jgi:hypothetical protein